MSSQDRVFYSIGLTPKYNSMFKKVRNSGIFGETLSATAAVKALLEFYEVHSTGDSLFLNKPSEIVPLKASIMESNKLLKRNLCKINTHSLKEFKELINGGDTDKTTTDKTTIIGGGLQSEL